MANTNDADDAAIKEEGALEEQKQTTADVETNVAEEHNAAAKEAREGE